MEVAHVVFQTLFDIKKYLLIIQIITNLHLHLGT